MGINNKFENWLGGISDIYIAICTCDIIDNVSIDSLDNLFYRIVDGRKMQDVASLMTEFQQKMPFFEGFGKNYFALYDCLCFDISWEENHNVTPPVVTPERIVIRVKNAEYLLNKSISDLLYFLQTMIEAGEYWSTDNFDPDFDFTTPVTDINRLIDMHKSTNFKLLLTCSTKEKLLQVKSNIDRVFTRDILYDKYRPIKYIYCETEDDCAYGCIKSPFVKNT